MTASLTRSFIYSTKVRVCIFQPPYLKKKKTRGGMHHSVRPCGKGAFSGDMKPQTARLGIYLYSVHNRFGRSQTGWPCWFTVGMSAVRGKMLPFGATPCETKQFLELRVGKTPRAFKTKGCHSWVTESKKWNRHASLTSRVTVMKSGTASKHHTSNGFYNHRMRRICISAGRIISKRPSVAESHHLFSGTIKWDDYTTVIKNKKM